MPNIKSAEKALRQSKRRQAQNKKKSDAFKKAVKAYRKSPSADLLTNAYQALDKAAKTGVIKKNKASRTKSRLSKLLKK